MQAASGQPWSSRSATPRSCGLSDWTPSGSSGILISEDKDYGHRSRTMEEPNKGFLTVRGQGYGKSHLHQGESSSRFQTFHDYILTSIVDGSQLNSQFMAQELLNSTEPWKANPGHHLTHYYGQHFKLPMYIKHNRQKPRFRPSNDHARRIHPAHGNSIS